MLKRQNFENIQHVHDVQCESCLQETPRLPMTADTSSYVSLDVGEKGHSEKMSNDQIYICMASNRSVPWRQILLYLDWGGVSTKQKLRFSWIMIKHWISPLLWYCFYTPPYSMCVDSIQEYILDSWSRVFRWTVCLYSSSVCFYMLIIQGYLPRDFHQYWLYHFWIVGVYNVVNYML